MDSANIFKSEINNQPVPIAAVENIFIAATPNQPVFFAGDIKEKSVKELQDKQRLLEQQGL